MASNGKQELIVPELSILDSGPIEANHPTLTMPPDSILSQFEIVE